MSYLLPVPGDVLQLHSHSIKVCYAEGRGCNTYNVPKVEQLFGFQYIRRLAFSDREDYLRVKKMTRRAIVDGRITGSAVALGLRYRRELKEAKVADVYIKWVDQRVGYGLFAGDKLSRGTFIGEYVGIVRPCSRFFGSVNEYCFRYPLYRFSLFVNTIDARDASNEMRFLNHERRRPNCIAVTTLNYDLLHICILAARDIDKDEQLTYDYGNRAWEAADDL